jgi:lipid-A-disaccharide synthase
MTAPVFILAGEPSGDQLAASIMDAVEGRFGKQNWFGIGGPLMQERGLASEAEMAQLSVMGFGAALSAYPRLSALANRLVQRIIEARPRAVITVDAKGFSLRLAARLKQRMAAEGWSAPVIHVVAPTVWAWGAWRAKSVARAVDRLLCLFPFEVDYFTPHGLAAHFIGHPEAFNAALMPRVGDNRDNGNDRSAAKRLLLLPGSRRSEIRRLVPVMRDAHALLAADGGADGTDDGGADSGVAATLVTVPHLRDEVAAALGADSGIEIVSGRDAFYQHLHQADAMMAASGTVTLQTALAGVPGVTCYRTSRLSAMIGRRLVRMDRVILPNALLRREVYPFLFQEEATPARLAAHVRAIFAADQMPDKIGAGMGSGMGSGTGSGTARRTADELRALLRGGSDDFETLVANALAPDFGPQD